MKGKLIQTLAGLIVSITLSGISSANTPTTLVGVTPGGFDVNQTGAATFNIPIEVPPGIAGMQPGLSLVYSSQGGRGNMGVGWSLSGLSIITRCPATLEVDGYISGVNFDSDDRFCLDGQKLLVSNSGAYGAEGTQYRTEIDNFSRVTSYGNMPGGGPKGFLVETKAGLRMYYGCHRGTTAQTMDCSQSAASGGVFEHDPTDTALTWSVNRIEDTVGNYIRFDYITNVTDNEFYLKRILYTGNGTTTPQRAVFFQYDQPASYRKSGYVNGYLTSKTRRLTDITTYLNYNLATSQPSNPIRNYELTYEPTLSPLTKQHRLQSIEECGYTNNTISHCFNPTVFTYQNGVSGFDLAKATSAGQHTALSLSSTPDPEDNLNFSTPDINGDSLADMCYRDADGIRCHLSDETGFAKGYTFHKAICGDGDQNNGICNTNNNHNSIQFVDINGDAKADLTYRGDEGIQVWLSNGTDFVTRQSSTLCNNTVCDSDNNELTINFPELNGDGLADLCFRTDGDGVVCYLNTGSSSTAENARWSNRITTGICSNSSSDCPGSNWMSIQYVDINGDHRSDLVYRSTEGLKSYLFNGTTFDHLQTSAICRDSDTTTCNSRDNTLTFKFGDINGDGLIDTCYRSDTRGFTCHLNTGSNQTSSRWNESAPIYTDICTDSKINGSSNPHYDARFAGCNESSNFDTAQLVDVNLDGMADFAIRMDEGYTIYYSTDQGFDYDNPLQTDVCQDYLNKYGNCHSANGYYYRQMRFAETNGDGKPDLVLLTQQGGISVDANAGMPDLLVSVTNGFGVETHVKYSSLLQGDSYSHNIPTEWPDYTNEALSQPDFYQFNAPMYVVDYFETSNGVGSLTKVDYSYYRAVRHRKRGFVGFEFVVHSKDGENGTKIEKHKRYHQTNRKLQGYELLDADYRRISSGSLTILSATSQKWNLSTSEAGFEFPYTEKTYSYSYNSQSAPPYTQTPSSTLITHNTEIDGYGNIKATQIKQYDYGGVFELEDDLAWSKSITNTYYETDAVVGDTYKNNWLLGRLKRTTVDQIVRGKTGTETKVTEFIYDSTTGLLTHEIVEPNNVDPNLTLTTSYGYDKWGNKETVSVTGLSRGWDEVNETLLLPANETRTTTTSYDHLTDNLVDGYFPVTISNHLNHTETHAYDARFGVRTSLKGPNGRTTSWMYDSLGRKTQENRHDGSYTKWTQRYCTDVSANCETGSQELYSTTTEVRSNHTTDLGAPPVTVWYDKLARDVRTQTQGFGGITIEEKSVYDQYTRLSRATKPYSSADPVLWACYTYDELGRILAESIPSTNVCDARKSVEREYGKELTNSTVLSKVYNYKPDNSVEIQEHKEWKDPNGRLVKVKDHYGSEIHYTYDHFGNLETTTNQGIVTSTTHDLRGRKTEMNDPSMGQWFYDYNAFGELQRQVDALDNEIIMAYDSLGRMTHRADREVSSTVPTVTTWTYDPTNAVGQLNTVSTPVDNYSRVHQYNADGLIQKVTTTILGQAYEVDTTYDEYSRTNTITYPDTGMGVSYPRLVTKNIYDASTGVLKGINNATSNTPYWTLNAINAQGKVTNETLGNGVINEKGYDATYDFITSIGASKGGTSVQNLTYTYDSIGNLRSRTDGSRGLAETFTYDKLNRLCNTSLNGTLTNQYRYDALGNITYKSGVGYYHYGANGASPYAVTSITAAGSLGTDAGCGTTALSHTAVPGDVNADGQFTSADYNIIADNILTGGTYPLAGADCQADGSINVLDGVCVTKKIAAAGNPLNNTGTGKYRNYLSDYTYNANGAMLSGAGRTFTYTAFNKVHSVVSGSNHSTFEHAEQGVSYQGYNDQRMRIFQTTEKGSTVYLNPTKTGGKLFEIDFHNEKGITYKHYIGGMLAVYEINDGLLNVSDKTQYFLKDHLGSTDIVTDASGNEVERLSFDAFGQRRDASNWQLADAPIEAQQTNQGYTGHEHLDNVGIIHMNGRLYDPILGRFLSADPNVQAPKNTQNLNRYSYVLNNPLSFTDPSGYFFKKLKRFVKKHWRTIASIAVVAFTGYMDWSPILGGFASGAVAGGDLKSAVLGGIGAGMFHGIGELSSLGYLKGGSKIFAHAMAGGVMSVAQGGKFGHGFMSGMATQAFFQNVDFSIEQPLDYAKNAFVAAVVGGTASVIGGGKFANGAVTGAFSRFFNDLGDHGRNDMSKRKYRPEVYDIEDLDLWYQVNRGVLSNSLGYASTMAAAAAPACGPNLLCFGGMTAASFTTKALSLVTSPNPVGISQQIAVTVDIAITVVNPPVGLLEPTQTTMKVVDGIRYQPARRIITRGMREKVHERQ